MAHVKNDAIERPPGSRGRRRGTGDAEANPLRVYRRLFFGVMAIAVVVHLFVDIYYLLVENGTLGGFMFDFWLTNVLIIGLVVPSYYMTKRVFLRYLESQARFDRLADSLPEVVFEMDLEGGLTYWNDRALKVFGYTREEVESGPYDAFDGIAAEDLDRAKENYRQVITRGAMSSIEYTARRKDGRTFPVIVSSSPIQRDGRTVGVGGIITDITKRKKDEEELRRVNAELDKFAQTVSHDLKNPIHRVMLSCHVMQELLEGPITGEKTRKTREVLGIAFGGLKQAHRLIEDLLTLAESGQVPWIVESVDLTGLVRSIVEERTDLITEKGVTVEVDDDLGEILASPTQLHQLFDNLISNAVKYCGGEQPVVEVRRLAASGDGGGRYLVRDNGRGIPDDLIDSLFLPFVKGPGGETGVGLSIAHKIAGNYGGAIRAYNDGGACFEFTLTSAAEDSRPDS